MPGFLEDKATEMLTNVMEEHGIKPGELNNRIKDTLDVIDEYTDIIDDVSKIAEDLYRDVENFQDDLDHLSEDIDTLNDNTEELKEVAGNFNESSDDMVIAMNNLADTLDKFNGWMEEMEKEE